MGIKGFTLIELVLVIALVGVLALSAEILSPPVPTAKLNTSAKQIQSDIEYAKQNATMTGVTHGVSFVAGGAYTVYRSTTATPLASPLTKQNMVITLSDKYPGVTIQTNYTVEFNSFGAPTTGGGGSVTIGNESGTKIISVTANTGKVTVQ